MIRKFFLRLRYLIRRRKWLFLDDRLNPPSHLSKMFDTVRSHDELKEWVEINGVPELVSFDHDLHPEHICFFFERGGFRHPPDPENEIFYSPTGYDSAKWLLERCEIEGVYPTHAVVHSWNPFGRDRVYSLLTGHTYEHKTEMKCMRINWGDSPL